MRVFVSRGLDQEGAAGLAAAGHTAAGLAAGLTAAAGHTSWFNTGSLITSGFIAG